MRYLLLLVSALLVTSSSNSANTHNCKLCPSSSTGPYRSLFDEAGAAYRNQVTDSQLAIVSMLALSFCYHPFFPIFSWSSVSGSYGSLQVAVHVSYFPAASSTTTFGGLRHHQEHLSATKKNGEEPYPIIKQSLKTVADCNDNKKCEAFLSAIEPSKASSRQDIILTWSSHSVV